MRCFTHVLERRRDAAHHPARLENLNKRHQIAAACLQSLPTPAPPPRSRHSQAVGRRFLAPRCGLQDTSPPPVPPFACPPPISLNNCRLSRLPPGRRNRPFFNSLLGSLVLQNTLRDLSSVTLIPTSRRVIRCRPRRSLAPLALPSRGWTRIRGWILATSSLSDFCAARERSVRDDAKFCGRAVSSSRGVGFRGGRTARIGAAGTLPGFLPRFRPPAGARRGGRGA